MTEANRSNDNQSVEEIENEFLTEEVFVKLFEHIDKLPHRQLEILKLNMEGKKMAEIADMLNLSRNNSQKIIGQGLRRRDTQARHLAGCQ